MVAVFAAAAGLLLLAELTMAAARALLIAEGMLLLALLSTQWRRLNFGRRFHGFAAGCPAAPLGRRR